MAEFKVVPVTPTESMVIDGFEAVSEFRDSDRAKEMSGCQESSEAARICWNAMLAATTANGMIPIGISELTKLRKLSAAGLPWVTLEDATSSDVGGNFLALLDSGNWIKAYYKLGRIKSVETGSDHTGSVTHVLRISGPGAI